MRSGSRGLERFFHASNAADASANSARVAAFRNGIHIENGDVELPSCNSSQDPLWHFVCGPNLPRPKFLPKSFVNLAYGFMASENVALIGFADHIAGG